MRRRHNLNKNCSLTRPVELAQENALPTTEQQLAVFERNGRARPDQRRFDMSVGVVFEMSEIWLILWYESPQETEHIALDVGIGIFVYRQAAGRVLREQRTDSFARGVFADKPRGLGRNVDHFLPLSGPNQN